MQNSVGDAFKRNLKGVVWTSLSIAVWNCFLLNPLILYFRTKNLTKIIHNLGLIDASSTRQRRHSTEDFDRKFFAIDNIIKSNEQADNFDAIKNIEELREILRNQNKYIQQLQLRVRINTPDILQSPTLEKLTEQNKV